MKICFVILEEFLGSDLLCHLLLKYLYNFDIFNNFIVECVLLDGVLSSYQFFQTTYLKSPQHHDQSLSLILVDSQIPEVCHGFK